MDGYADGMWADGNICYGATGMHARKVPKSEQKDRGNGLEIFDTSNPDSPRRLGGVKFPQWHLTYLDSWTVQVSGNLAYVTDSNNGLYIVNVSDKANPVVVASGRLPELGNKEDCVGSVAIGHGVLYVGAIRGGLYVTDYPQATPPKRGDEEALEIADIKETDTPGFLRYDTGNQARRLFLDGDNLYVAASHGGILVYKVSDQGLTLKKQYPMECCYDVAARDGKLYSAEGGKGFAVYQIKDNGELEELGRDKKLCQHIRLCSNPKFMLYTSGGMEIYVKDISDPRNMKNVFKHRGGGMFYTDTAGDQDLDGIIPVNRHGGGIIWLDLNGEKPVLKHHQTKAISGQDSAPALLGKRYILSAGRKGYFSLDPKNPDLSHVKSIPVKKRGSTCSGTASVDENIVVFTNRATGDVTTIDFSDINNPVKVEQRSHRAIAGSPGRAAFWNHRMLIPAGHQGVLFEKSPSQPATN